MATIDDEILTISQSINKNIDKFDGSERGLLSQNILNTLRHFVEHICLKEYAQGQELETSFDNLKLAVKKLQPKSRLGYLRKFHNSLQGMVSHYMSSEENSERLMLKYYVYLLRIKKDLRSYYGLEVLENISKFPINTDRSLHEFYEKIVEQITNPKTARLVSTYADRYYIKKIKPFVVNERIFYEVTFTVANSEVSKFDRVIAFTELDMTQNYSVELSVIHDKIKVVGKEMPIQIIDKWAVSIRPCELNNFAKIFGPHPKIQTNSIEYKNLMTYLTESGLSLLDIVELAEDEYVSTKKEIVADAQATHIFDLLDKCRAFTQNNRPGGNVIRYLLHCFTNKIIRRQYDSSGCGTLLGNLNLHCKCTPFDRMPFYASLRKHNPRISSVFECIDSEGREHELFAKLLWNNVETKGKLYTAITELPENSDVDALIKLYNSKLYLPRHANRIIEKSDDHVFIKGYEEDTVDILNLLLKLSDKGLQNYSNSVNSWLQSSSYVIDCEDKKGVLSQIFENSRVALIYGSAGTGKTTLIKHISNFFNDRTKLFLANYNPAVANLERRVDVQKSTFKTITRFLSDSNTDVSYDLIVIDECSTVSNTDMLEVLKKADFKLLLLVGDIFQIESIIFGNWFSVAQSFIPQAARFELVVPWRTKNKKLLDLWSKVRNVEDTILEHMTKNDYSTVLDESIFTKTDDDEIILCLNYDGLYGINNINKFLQSSNQNPPIEWEIQTYKIGDPILFNEANRFRPLIYNNLKGKIADIQKREDHIQFDIEIDVALNELDVIGYDFQLIGSSDSGNSIIRFIVNKSRSTDEDDGNADDTLMPFQVAYAVSIHKAQGLEYNSVKVVITNETEELITHNIFYTAITRAKEKLKVYWTPETQNKILSGLKRIDNTSDVAILRKKYKF